MKDIWWDVRPSPDYGTIEIRVCDALPTLAENLALAAFIHASAAAMYEKVRTGNLRPEIPDWMLRENKWRAARHGVEADLVSDATGSVKPLKTAVRERLTCPP